MRKREGLLWKIAVAALGIYFLIGVGREYVKYLNGDAFYFKEINSKCKYAGTKEISGGNRNVREIKFKEDDLVTLVDDNDPDTIDAFSYRNNHFFNMGDERIDESQYMGRKVEKILRCIPANNSSE